MNSFGFYTNYSNRYPEHDFNMAAEKKSGSQANPWKTLSGEEKYDNRWINVTEYQVINPAGGKGIYGKVHFKNKAIGIVALDDNQNTWLVGQYRYTLDQFCWEIPEGGGSLHEDPLDAAKRELKEETGLIARRWTLINRLHTSNSVTDEEGFIFLAEELEEGENELEETEADLQVKRVSLTEALQMISRQEITDSISIIGLMLAARLKGF
jgi:8-oxo-dGTP pyrophosphatase MutT (NUDIX family)